MDERRKEIYKNLSPAEKLKISINRYHSARSLKAAALRKQHPDWSEDQMQRTVREIFLYAPT